MFKINYFVEFKLKNLKPRSRYPFLKNKKSKEKINKIYCYYFKSIK